MVCYTNSLYLSVLVKVRSSHRWCSMKKLFLNIPQNSQESNCARVKKETLAQVFSCEFCEIFKNTFFIEHLRTTASKKLNFELKPLKQHNIILRIYTLSLMYFQEIYVFLFCFKSKFKSFPSLIIIGELCKSDMQRAFKLILVSLIFQILL